MSAIQAQQAPEVDVEDRRKTDVGSLLCAGGDQRIVLDATGLNKYGCSPIPRPDTIEFGSCTSSFSSPRGWQAANQAQSILEAGQQSVASLLEQYRQRLSQLLELPAHTEIALIPSGTDAEMLATAIAARDGRLLNIIVGPSEVGSGTQNAAACCYYDSMTPSGASAKAGEPISQELASRVTIQCIGVRDSRGTIRPQADLQAEITNLVADSVDKYDRIMLHVVTHSKTGITAPSLPFALRLKQELGEQFLVVVDAAQGRLSREQTGELVARGCFVIWTGSKFVGGPPFAGAFFTPSNVLAEDFRFPAEFDAFLTRSELPASWQRASEGFSSRQNVGIVLRWAAALAELEAYTDTPRSVRSKIFRAFEEIVSVSFNDSESVKLQPAAKTEEAKKLESGVESFTTVFSFCVEPLGSTQFSKTQLRQLHNELNRRGFHLGQPVQLSNDNWALRIALSMPMLVQIAEDEGLGETLNERIDQLKNWLQELSSLVEELAQTMTTTDGQQQTASLTQS